MKREKMVTRTIFTTECDVMCLDTETADVSVKVYTLPGTYENTADMIKAIKKSYETESFKPVKVTAYTEKETLYGMSESDFIRYSKVLPPRGTKESEEN